MDVKDVDKLANLSHYNSLFVHMNGSWKNNRKIEIIKTGSLWYKKANVNDVVVEGFGDDTAVLWNRITFMDHVRGNYVSNELTVTEVCIKNVDDWKLANLTFSKTMTRE